MCRNPDGLAATAVAALKGGKVVGVVVTSGGSGYADVSVSLAIALAPTGGVVVVVLWSGGHGGYIECVWVAAGICSGWRE